MLATDGLDVTVRLDACPSAAAALSLKRRSALRSKWYVLQNIHRCSQTFTRKSDSPTYLPQTSVPTVNHLYSINTGSRRDRPSKPTHSIKRQFPCGFRFPGVSIDPSIPYRTSRKQLPVVDIYSIVEPERTCLGRPLKQQFGKERHIAYLLASLLDLLEQVIITNAALNNHLLLLEADVIRIDTFKHSLTNAE